MSALPPAVALSDAEAMPTAPAQAPTRRRRNRIAWCIAAAALVLDVAVCAPFLYDPLGWLEPTLAAPGGNGRTEYVLFLAGAGTAAARERFLAEHPAVRVEHEGGWAGTVVVSLPEAAQELAERLRGQPFVRLMTRSGTALCRSI